MLGNEVPAVIRIILEYTPEHREHIKYDTIKYVSPTEKSSVWGQLSFHWELAKGHLGLNGPYSRQDQGAKATWEPHEICTWGVSSQGPKIAIRGEAGSPGKVTSIVKAEMGLEKRLC